jgi:DNA-binding transcriptional LysR family regulator
VIRLDDLQVFVSATGLGSLSAAARELDMSPALASAALKRLEDALGARLLTRSTRSLRLTRDGQRYLEHARAILAAEEAGRHTLEQNRDRFTGLLTVAMPSDLGRSHLAGWLDAFRAPHPDLQLQLRISDRLTDLYRQPVDVAIRYGIAGDSGLIARPLVPDNRRIACASPDYLARHGAPQTPQALKRHNCLCMTIGTSLHNQWSFGEQTVAVGGDRSADDGELVRRWALAGAGIAYKSQLDVHDDLQSGRLVALLGDFPSEHVPLYLACADRQSMSPVVSALGDALRRRLADWLGTPRQAVPVQHRS